MEKIQWTISTYLSYMLQHVSLFVDFLLTKYGKTWLMALLKKTSVLTMAVENIYSIVGFGIADGN